MSGSKKKPFGSLFSNLKTRPKILLGICLPLVLLALLGGVSIYGINSIVGTSQQVDRTHVVLGEAAAIVNSAVDMETGMRGYLLAGKEDFLKPYKRGETATYQGIADLKKTVNNDPKQVARLAAAENILREWQEEVTEPTIQLRRVIGDAATMNDMAKLVGEARGKIYFDKVRLQLKKFQDREAQLLKIRRAGFKLGQESVSRDFEQLRKMIGLISHSQDALAAAQRILFHAVDMDTAMRGYLLAGSSELLTPYKESKKGFYQELSELIKTVDKNPAQVALLKEIKALTKPTFPR